MLFLFANQEDRGTITSMKKQSISIADRSNVFYWQTDRAVTPQEAGHIWADRHRYFTDEELLEKINISSIKPLDLSDQTNLGNVNSVRAVSFSY